MKISFIHTAFGFGSRFSSNKLLAPLKGKAFHRHGLDCICHVTGELKRGEYQTEALVVSQYGEILEQAESQGPRVAPNRLDGQRITASLRLRTDPASPKSEALLFSVADQPYMSPLIPKEFIRGFRLVGKGMGYVHHQGKRGSPVVFASAYREELTGLRGDRGGGAITKTHPEDVQTMEAPGEELKDVDQAEDLGAAQNWRRYFSKVIRYGQGKADRTNGNVVGA